MKDVDLPPTSDPNRDLKYDVTPKDVGFAAGSFLMK